MTTPASQDTRDFTFGRISAKVTQVTSPAPDGTYNLGVFDQGPNRNPIGDFLKNGERCDLNFKTKLDGLEHLARWVGHGHISESDEMRVRDQTMRSALPDDLD